MIGSLILIAMMFVAAGVYAQTTDKEKKHTKSECTLSIRTRTASVMFAVQPQMHARKKL